MFIIVLDLIRNKCSKYASARMLVLAHFASTQCTSANSKLVLVQIVICEFDISTNYCSECFHVSL